LLSTESVSGFRRESAELFMDEKMPSLALILSFSTQITTGIKWYLNLIFDEILNICLKISLMAAEEEIVIGTKNGIIFCLLFKNIEFI
jgi:hypothetical protein